LLISTAELFFLSSVLLLRVSLQRSTKSYYKNKELSPFNSHS